MKMKSTIQNSTATIQQNQFSYNNDDFDYINIDLNYHENYLDNEQIKENFANDLMSLNSKDPSTLESNTQNAIFQGYDTISSQYYNYKLNAPESDAMTIMQNEMVPSMPMQTLQNTYNSPNICPTTGFDAVTLSTNPSMPCSCSYCLSFYQNQWYINYYNTMAQSSYIMSSQTDQNSTGKAMDYSYSPLVVMKNNDPVYNSNQELQEIDKKLAHLTPIYINQPVPSNTEHFQRRSPFKKRDHNALSWLVLYLELEKDVESPTMNARIAWINDMHHIIYTKLTSGLVSRWQYEYEFSNLRNLITQKSIECDDIFRNFPRLCHCGERFQTEMDLNDHSSHCVELKIPWHRCLCGKLFDQHYEYFQHIFSGMISCPMAVYNLWIFFEKYRRRRYKCFCSVVFHNFWVYYVHMGECIEYQNYFQRNCYFCQDSAKKSTINNSFWSYPIVGPLKDLVLHSKIQ